MTSKERHEVRYQRERARRKQKRRERCESLGGVESVFSFDTMFQYGLKCCNGVRWKQSTQNFELHLLSGTAARRRQILSGDWVPKKGIHFPIFERGKLRWIDAPHINDRQIQKVLTNEVLYPLYVPSMIYDNGASMKGKGLHFTFKRLKKHLAWWYRHYGREGYVVVMDIHGFFPLAPHDNIIERHKCLIPDDGLRKIADRAVNITPGGVGMPLGVEPSQLEMVSMPSRIDNYIKCQMRVKCSAHYMDDYYAFARTREIAQKILNKVTAMFESIGVVINRSKCFIRSLKKPFKFCKATFQIMETGRIITHGCRDGMKRYRRKMKFFAAEVPKGARFMSDVNELVATSVAYYKNYNDNGRVVKIKQIYHAMFGKEAA